jgi:nicotinamidase-related amidase
VSPGVSPGFIYLTSSRQWETIYSYSGFTFIIQILLQGEEMLKPEETVFILIDVQGKLAEMMFDKERFFKNLRILVQSIRILDIPVVWAEQYPEGLGDTIMQIRELLDGLEPISKKTFSVCGHKELNDRVNSFGRKQAIVAGMEAHVCVYQTVSDLLDLGYGVTIIADAISSRTSENREIGLRRMTSDGARIASTEMILFELVHIAEGDKFKKIAKLVK